MNKQHVADFFVFFILPVEKLLQKNKFWKITQEKNI